MRGSSWTAGAAQRRRRSSAACMAADRSLEVPVLVPRSLGAERATVRERLLPVAAMQVDDAHFRFDASFVLPEAREDFVAIDIVRRVNPGAPLSLFGHADPVGDDEYNKILSGRRALAMFAVLVRRADIWERLHAKPHGRDQWSAAEFGVMRAALGIGDGTDGVPRTVGERATIFAAYMEFLCRDLVGESYRLDPVLDFLARGADKEAKGDVQGCGEFNPDLILAAGFPGRDQRGPVPARDQANAANRRVVALFFTPGSAADPKQWPCPRALEGTAACRKRLWSDAAKRRAAGSATREHKLTGDTYACRFYDRIALEDPRSGSLGSLGTGRFDADAVDPGESETDPHPASNSEVFEGPVSPRVTPPPQV